MTYQGSTYTIPEIHRLLADAFDDAGLDTFVQANYPDARGRFGRGIGKDEKITTLIDYCTQQARLEWLVAAALARAPWTHIPLSLPRRCDLAGPGSKLPGWRLPYLSNALFTGRIEPLQTLARALLHGGAGLTLVTQAVQGVGGVGKTQLAVEFAYRYGRYFRGVHWLNAAQPAALEAEVAACGLAMGLPNWPGQQPEQAAYTLKTWSKAGPRLVILDNLEDVPTAHEWLGRLGSGGTVCLLLTTQRPDLPRDLGLTALPLEVFKPEESLDFLRSYLPAGRAGDGELAALAQQLGHFPLSLDLARRCVAGLPMLSVAGYAGRLRQVLADPTANSWLAEMGNQISRDLAATFALSWQHVTDRTAQRVFALAVWCAPNRPIPCRVLQQAAGLDEVRCDAAVRLLAGLGLVEMVEMEPDDVGPALHPLLAELGRKAPALTSGHPSWKSGGVDTPLAAVVQALADLSAEANQTGLPARFAPLWPHVEAAAVWAEEAGLEQAGTLWSNLGSHGRSVADHSGTRVAFERALAVSERVYTPDHPAVAVAHNNLGLALYNAGDLAGALAAFKQALIIDEGFYGLRRPTVARDVFGLGLVLKDLGDLAGAQAAFERALCIDEQSYGPDHLEVARDISNLGVILQAQGDLAGARAAFERALATGERLYGPDHPDIAKYSSNLGDVLKDLGDLTGAREAFERALVIEERAYGPDHPEVAKYVNNLGRVLQDLGDLARARAAFERALVIDEQVHGPNHLAVAADANNLGFVLQDLGDLVWARAAYERALDIRRKFLPVDHPDIVRVQCCLDSL